MMTEVDYRSIQQQTIEDIAQTESRKLASPESADQSVLTSKLIRSYSEPLPERYKEDHNWDVEIVKAPECPEVQTLRLVKTSPFNFELRKGLIYCFVAIFTMV